MTGLVPWAVHVPHQHVMIKEKYGKFVSILPAGSHWINPLTERAHSFSDWGSKMNKNHKFLELAQQHWESGMIGCHTIQEVPVSISARVDFRIIDPYKATYEADILPESILAACQEAFRNTIAKYRLEDLSEIRETLSDAVCNALKSRTDQWGIELHHVAIGKFAYPPEVEKEIIEAKRLEKEQIRLRVASNTRQEQAEKQAGISRIEAETKAAQEAIAEQAMAERAKIAAQARAETEQTQATSQAAIARIAAEANANAALIEARGRANAERELSQARAAAYAAQTAVENARLRDQANIVGKEQASLIMAESKRAEVLKDALTSPQNKIIVANESLNLKLNDPEALFKS